MAINWTKLYKKYKGMWVALLDDEKTVVGSGKTLKEALAKAREKGYNFPIVSRMPETLDAYIGAL
ncbi:hypothetical protein A2456_00285 [Candidatus Nomurabacteria bacterium RIFOXYC2_FULL_36_19]|uniref:DUF5678 domain-containing protein n=1 Tax=Candidatus Nomurabacteria bacterium RIFOXYC2_FULL_36_19 TaxID=1801806 RepID=A0A1F6YRQ8_9BACT|nr:MAG: hypothetical protein A2456_00285 [Candidatus Nomurabacteria bacterium RIFOXYC2_FULL_36_19]OGJ15051.1 MAG: hypothetical protein A2554_02220 [Candidatus Nomurabacteria bacterium RIFOXYD2_FULL_35_12]